MPPENPNSSSRKLAAILFADIAGYTAMMQSDEGKTMNKLRHYQTVLKSEVAQHKGEIIKNYGDGSLCLFNSVLDAVHCAKALQVTFQSEPVIPLRIGLHLGDVMYEENDIYGNSINVASRIESMGIAGAVLMSADIHKRIKNQEAFKYISLGTFEFKNVDEPMEVFALANEGFVVPHKDQMKGKLKSPKSSNKSLLVLLSFLLIALTGFYYFKQDNSLLEKNDRSNKALKVTEELRTKRVMVVPFENQTQNESFKIFGNMVADWLTQGLIEMKDVNVISAYNISENLQQKNSNEQLVQATGVDIKIVGRYYIIEDQIVIHANLVDARTGEIIKNLSNIEGDQKDLMTLIENLSEEVLGFWATKDKIRYSKNPPTYKAYTNYLKGNASFYRNWGESEKFFTAAIEEDSTFYIASLKLLVGYQNNNGSAEAKQVDAFLKRHIDEFTEWEKLRYQSLQILDIEQTIDINKRLFDLDRSAMDPFANIIIGSRATIHPEIGIDFIEQLNDPIVDNNPRAQTIIKGNIPVNYFFMEDYQKVIEYPIDSKKADFYSIADIIHLRALIRLSKMEEFETKFNQVLQKFGQRENHEIFTSILYKAICDEFVIQKDSINLLQIANRFDAYNSGVRDINIGHNNRGYIHWYRGNYREAINSWHEQKFYRFHQLNEGLRVLLTTLAHIKLGNKDQVNQLRPLLQFRYDEGMATEQLRFQSAIEYANGVIAHNEGNNKKAIQHLKSAIEHGAFVNRESWIDYYLYFNYKNDPFLSNAFRNSPEFLELFQ